MRTSQQSAPALTVCVCLLAVLALWGLTATAAAADPSLEAVGGEDGRTVPLQVCPKNATGAEPAHTCTKTSGRPYRGGKLTVLIRNTTDKKKTVEVEYLPKGATEPQTLPGDCDRIFLVGCDMESPSSPESQSGGPLSVASGASLSISVGLALPLSESASAIDGTLVVSTEGEKPLAIPVSGEERSYTGVTVSPSTLPVDSSDGSVPLTLGGPELVEYLRSRGGEESSAILYGDDGETAEANLTLPTAGEVEAIPTETGTAGTPEGADGATATVTVSGDPGVGKYTGKLALPGLPADTGTATIELHQHRSCVCAVLTFLLMLFIVFLGILVTGVGTRIVTMASRRKLLTEVLTQTYNVFVEVVKKTEKDAEGNEKRNEIASWHLDDLLAEDPADEENEEKPTPDTGRLQGLPALKYSIETARSSTDLDEDAKRVLDMIARMQRWLRVEPLARRLTLVKATKNAEHPLPEEPPKDKDGEPKPPLEWADSNTVRDTRHVAGDGAARAGRPGKGRRAGRPADVPGRLAQQHGHRLENARSLEEEGQELDEALGAGWNAEERKLGEQDGAPRAAARVVEGRRGTGDRPDPRRTGGGTPERDVPGEMGRGLEPVHRLGDARRAELRTARATRRQQLALPLHAEPGRNVERGLVRQRQGRARGRHRVDARHPRVRLGRLRRHDLQRGVGKHPGRRDGVPRGLARQSHDRLGRPADLPVRASAQSGKGLAARRRVVSRRVSQHRAST